MRRFDGRRALVTGGGRGIGAGVCRRLAQEGAEVVIASRTLAPAEELAQEIGATAVQVDVADLEAAQAVVRDAGPLDVLVNNAGYDEFGFFTDTSPQQWQDLMQTNFFGVLACTQAALPAMQEARYGRIVNIGSEAGRLGSKGYAVYASSKAALHGFTKSLARENARFGITVNTVAVGPVDTPLLDKTRALPKGDQMVEAMKAGTLLGRLGTLEEVAAAVAFLAAEEAAYVTGEHLGVSGGMGVSAS
ncbi:SDR family NAD(P)-dependent oxidoreductase [Conexibacter sp. SYSU D00693]|uniref:SDR family NAD(P)-dependent oxidoreductase n=1 Tax=Conexibacter sp. SYSU D00693 TaxID=2812560 RepID=UPI00196A7789|nr:SDR family oxidoreductase [Conexibacter sp. SYSU D00693]